MSRCYEASPVIRFATEVFLSMYTDVAQDGQ
jgi:hypothetical protein